MRIISLIIYLCAGSFLSAESGVLKKIENDLKVELYPTSSLAEERRFIESITPLYSIIELKKELGQISEEEFNKRKKTISHLGKLAIQLTGVLKELEKMDASVYILQAIPGSQLEGFEAGYIALIDEVPYYFIDGDKLQEILKQESHPDWKPQQAINDWRSENLRESHIQSEVSTPFARPSLTP